MAQKKISALPQDSSPTVTDSIPTYDVETTLTKRSLISDLITLFFNNIPAGAHSDVTRGGETLSNCVASGGVITGDSVAVNKNASMTAAVCYINGRRISINAVTARTYTASKDTYVDVLDNLDGTGTLVYTEVTNNAASPALAANSLRLGIVVTGATTIAATTSIAQNGYANILPTISSQILKGFDSLGNLVYPKGPSNPRLMQNSCQFRVYRNAAQNTINGTTKVLFDTKTYDKNANVDVVTNNRFVAPVAGTYLFSATGQVISSANFRFDLYKNGAAVSNGVNNGGSGVNQGSIVTDQIQLAAGDYIEVFVSAASAVALFVGPTGVYFTGTLLSAS